MVNQFYDSDFSLRIAPGDFKISFLKPITKLWVQPFLWGKGDRRVPCFISEVFLRR
jgi:hypothetical protein